MEPSKAKIKEFFKQKKSGNKIGKAKSSSSTAKKKLPKSKQSASHGSDIAHDFVNPKDEIEMKLQQFDMNMVYGPCIGISRLDRWQRAKRVGLNPPEEIRELLKSSDVKQESLWEGRV